MKKNLLDKVNNPNDLSKLNFEELKALCAEVRTFLIETISKTGGHLSSNLGVVELTIALHRTLQSPTDAIFFDVGHQCYIHKILTGRKNRFDLLRKNGGISGFPNPKESIHDPVFAGHASAAVSSAVGLARAKKLRGEPGLVIVVIGDGAFTGGMAYEAINNMQNLDNMVIILNDNKMSISRNVGALAQYLTILRTNPGYNIAKDDVRNVLEHTPIIGGGVVKNIRSVKRVLRKNLYPSTFFEEMGLRYIGPIDGHNLPLLCKVFRGLRRMKKPLLIHVETTKGKGFLPAEKNPGAFHGVGGFDVQALSDPDVSPSDSFSTVFGKELALIAEEDKRICAITAAMKYGTGLQYFKKAHTERFFDVGMAEAHAVTFAGGLAAGGMRPVVAVYSSFLQRAYDQIVQDVLLGKQDVLFAVDRAGLVSGDGETHQGIYDTAFLTQQQSLLTMAPSNYAELIFWLRHLLKNESGPRAIRYPRGTEMSLLSDIPCSGKLFDVYKEKGAKCAIVTYGPEVEQVFLAKNILKKHNIAVDIYKIVQINPIPADLASSLLKYSTVLFVEEGAKRGGIGEHLGACLFDVGFRKKYIIRAVEHININHADRQELLSDEGLDAQSLADIFLCEEKK